MTDLARIKSVDLGGPVGRLEALLNEGSASPQYAALVAHPHPLGGGTMHNKVVFHAMKALNSFGFPVLRFNFRGVGTSQGKHDNGLGEQEDVRAALDWLEREYGLPILFAGFSFGAAAGLPVACPDEKVKALISLGTPASAEGRIYTYHFLADCTKPKLFLSGDQDQYAPKEILEKLINGIAEPKRFVLITGADHFFAGHLEEMRDALQQWVREVIRPSASLTV